MTKATETNPFIFSKPVLPDKFIGREYELDSVGKRFLGGGSYVISGQPKIGKSSLFHKMSSLISKAKTEDKVYLPITVTSSLSSSNFTEQDFWKHALTSVGETNFVKDENNSDDLSNFHNFLKLLQSEKKHYVFLVDGLGWILEKMNMLFWRQMTHALQIPSSNLSFVAYTRLTYQQSNEKLMDTVSPFLGLVEAHTLVTFSEKQTHELLDTYSKDNYFTPKDKRIIWQLSGGHPFLVQISASLIWEKRFASTSISKIGYSSLFDEILNIAKPHFWDTWRYLSPNQQTIGLMLSIRDVAQTKSFDVSELDNALNFYRNDVQTLKQIGFLRIENGKIYLSSLCFGLWVVQNQVLGKDMKEPDEFLRENLKIIGSLTNKQIENIANSTKKILSDFKNTAVNIVDISIRSKLGLPPN